MKPHMITTLVLMSSLSWASSVRAAPEDKDLGDVVRAFSRAGDQQDAPAMQNILHPEFRTLFTFGRAGDATLLPREQYLAMLRAKKLGGDIRTVYVSEVQRPSHNVAYVKSTLVGKKGTLHSLMILVRHKDRWTVYQDSVRLDK